MERGGLVTGRRWPAVAALTVAVAWVGSGWARSVGAATTGEPPVQAVAYAVRSGVDGSVLAERADAVPRPIASITKLMTVLVALDHLPLDRIVTVPRAATRIGEATMDLRPSEQIAVRELVEGALIPSANDAADTLAFAAANGSMSRFVSWMNQKAQELGLADTHFVNPHGLDAPGHVSSARDIITLLAAALANPVIRRYAATERAELLGHGAAETTDDLLSRYPPLVAGKTGHTDGAGWSEVAAARQGPVTIYASVLGEPTREQRNDDLQALLSWGLRQYRDVRAIDSGRVYATARAPYGRPAVPLVADRVVVLLQRAGVPLVEHVTAPTDVALPVRKGEPLGTIRIYQRGELVASARLVAARAEPRPGALARTRWYATRTLQHLVSLVS